MYKICVCGHHGIDNNIYDGQRIKVNNIYNALVNEYSNDNVYKLNLEDAKGRRIDLIKRCIFSVRYCNNIIIMPGKNALRVLAPLFYMLNIIPQRRMHYVVVGGWLDSFIVNHPKIKKIISEYTGVYVETNEMKTKLEDKGLTNVIVLPNFKSIDIMTSDKISNNYEHRLCTFSRVVVDKGIDDAIDGVIMANNLMGKNIFSLDIYGFVDEAYKEHFYKKIADIEYVNYKGLIPQNKSVEYVKNYFVLLFPTYYEGEGFAGTLIDALCAGVPIIASDWKYNHEIVTPDVGILVPIKSPNKIAEAIIALYNEGPFYNIRKNNCINKAKNYSLPDAILPLIERIS